MESAEQYILRRVDGGDMQHITSFPRYFEIETVNACNARCPMCTIDDWDRRDGLMKDDLFEKIADEICEHADEVKRVSLYRDGEPLLDKRLAKKVSMLKQGGVQRVAISTNAALLTEDRAESLLCAGIDEVLLSVDSLNPLIYEKIRVGLDFDEVMLNCLKFIELRDQLQSDCQVWVRMIRQESNKNEWPTFEQFWRSRLNADDRVDYRNIHNWGGQLVNFKSVSPASIKEPCIALWSLMVIFASGEVPLCNVDSNLKFPLGNVRDSSIAELWQSREQNRRREMHMSGNRSDVSMCAGCTVWSEEATLRKAA